MELSQKKKKLLASNQAIVAALCCFVAAPFSIKLSVFTTFPLLHQQQARGPGSSSRNSPTPKPKSSFLPDAFQYGHLHAPHQPSSSRFSQSLSRGASEDDDSRQEASEPPRT